MKKILLVLAVSLSGLIFSQHKFLDTPKLSEEDLKSEKSAKFGDVPAEILYRSYHFRIDYDGSLYKNIVSRVKIYNKDNAADYLNQEIAVYDDNRGSRETLSNLKANTYNFDIRTFVLSLLAVFLRNAM